VVLWTLVASLWIMADAFRAAGITGAAWAPALLVWAAQAALFALALAAAGAIASVALPPVPALALLTALCGLLQFFLIVDAASFRALHRHLDGLAVTVVLMRPPGTRLEPGGARAAFGLWAAAAAPLLAAAVVAIRLRPGWNPFRRFRHLGTWLAAAALLVVVSEKLVHAVADLRGDPVVLGAGRIVPFPLPFTAQGLAARRFGFVPGRGGQPGRPVVSTAGYPALPPGLRAAPGPNVLIIVVEAWRVDMLDRAVTPRLAAFAKGAWTYERHYSGGNASRFGVFGLLYGLPGTYWHPFLADRRGPVLIPFLRRAGYRIRVVASTPLSSPEFLETAFADVPGECDDRMPARDSTDRDVLAGRRLEEWLAGDRDPRRPFFAVMFLDSSHPPYHVPPGGEVFRPSAGREDFARYRNALHHEDAVCGRLLEALRRAGTLDRTIVFVTGDHGEEFGEAGHRGHARAFTDWQVRVPLIVRFPGESPRVVQALTSHLDVVPTILDAIPGGAAVLPWTQGWTLRRPGRRTSAIVAGWDQVAVVAPPRTYVFGSMSYNLGVTDVFDAGSKPVLGPRAACRAVGPILRGSLADLSRFLR